MPSDGERGPSVPDDDDVFRAILYPLWWSRQEDRPSSAAFDDEVFSVDLVRLTTPERTLARFQPGSGLVRFNCGAARRLGFDTRHEPDEQYPDNEAHAHVYFDGGKSVRKKRARDLARLCAVERRPGFPEAGVQTP